MRKQSNLRHYCYDLNKSEDLQPKALQLLPLTSGCDEANDQPTPSPATFEYKPPDDKEFSSNTTSDETSSSKPPVAKAKAKKLSVPKVKAKAKSRQTAKAKAAAKEAGHAPESEETVPEGDGSKDKAEPKMVPVDPAEFLSEVDQDGNVYDREPDLGDDLEEGVEEDMGDAPEEGVDEGEPKVKPKTKAAPKAKAKAKAKNKAKANPKAKGKGKAKPKGGAKAKAKSRQWFGETGEALEDTETVPDDPHAASSDAAPGAMNVKRRPAAQPKKAGFMQCAAVTVSHVLLS